jgi:two-component system OmpR family sensor kinase
MLEHVESALSERQNSETLLRQFVADASHELRTPVAVIRSHAEYAQMTAKDLDHDVDEALGRITAESIRMGTLVDDLLLLARLDSGRPLQRSPVDLTRIVLDAAVDAQALDPQHNWQLDLPEREVIVDGDANPLRQVIVNLLANAAEHTPPGTRTTITLTESDALATLVVADNGPGIPADFLPHIFERFARADSAREHTSGETGLGLAIVEAIVHAHDGTIGATSEPGATTFTVQIPLPRERADPVTSDPHDGAERQNQDPGKNRADGQAEYEHQTAEQAEHR